MATRTMVIGELAVKVKSADLAAQVIDTAIASDFEVEVYYKLHAQDEDGMPLRNVEVTEVQACANVHFAGTVTDTIVRRGSDMLPLFSGPQVTVLEDAILEAITGGGDE